MESNEDELMEQFKLKRMIRKLETAKGTGTSMISVIIPSGKKISDFQKLLQDEIGKADKIKDRVNRQGVVKAITSVKEKLRMYNKTPPNGLLIYSGEVFGEDGKTEERFLFDFEPIKQINTSLYKCDNQFDTTALRALLVSKEKFGFIIVDGSGWVFGTVQGSSRDILLKFTVDLPKKHGRGGQSSQRFGRIRLEKRLTYVKKVWENATKVFITNEMPNIEGIIIAGYADFKTQVNENNEFDQRLKKIVINLVDISYGGEQGFNQAIQLSKDCLSSLKLVQEQNIIGKMYEEINTDSGKIVYGIQNTMNVFLDAAVEKLLCFDNLDCFRVVLRNKKENNEEIRYLTKKQIGEFFDTNKSAEAIETMSNFDIISSDELVDWIADNHKEFGSEIIFVTDASPEGSQFVKGFGGLAGFMRFKYDLDAGNNANFQDEDDDDFI